MMRGIGRKNEKDVIRCDSDRGFFNGHGNARRIRNYDGHVVQVDFMGIILVPRADCCICDGVT